jgi:uncharacterized protein YecT (DUF1311 family)
MSAGLANAAVAVAVVLCLAGAAGAQQPDEPDPCADAIGKVDSGACWSREADRAEVEMRQLYDSLLQRLPGRAADALRKAQKAWLDARETQIVLLSAIANPTGRHRWEDSICAAIARRQITLQRTQVLRRLAQPAGDDACPL